MSLTNVKAAGKSSAIKGRIDDGTYVARVIQLIDLGVQKDEYEGQEKIGHKVFINFEFPTETMKNEEGDELPRWLGKEFTVSLHEKAVMTKLVGAADPEGKFTAKGRNLKGLLGLPLMVTVGTTSTGNPKIAGVARLMKGLQVPEVSKDPLFFDLEDGDVEQFNKLPEWVQTKIKAGLNFDAMEIAKKLGDVVDKTDGVEDDAPY